MSMSSTATWSGKRSSGFAILLSKIPQKYVRDYCNLFTDHRDGSRKGHNKTIIALFKNSENQIKNSFPLSLLFAIKQHYVWSASGSHHEKLLALPCLHCQATVSTTCAVKCYTEDPHLCNVILCESMGQESSECALTHTSFPREHQQLVLDSFHFFLNFLNGFMEGKTTEKALINKRYLYLKMEGVG